MGSWWRSLQREWQRACSNRWDGAMISWVPLLTIALMCWIFSSGQPYRLPIAVWSEDHSSLSRQLVRMLDATPGLQVRMQVASRDEAAYALLSMRVYGVVYIPPGMARDVRRGGQSTVTLLHNAQLATASSLLQRDVQQVVGTLSAGVEMQARAKRGEPAQVLQVRMEPVATKLVALFNVSTNYELFLASTLIPALVHILSMTAGAWSVGKEMRDRTLGQWLEQSNTWSQALAALLGKLALPAVLLWASGMLGLLYLVVLRGWAVAGSVVWMALALLGLVAASVAAGAALAALTMSLRTALSGSGLLSAPAFAFSGVGFPLLAMGEAARSWALAMPYTHYARLQLEQWQMGAPVMQTVPVMMGLWLAAAVLMVVATTGLQRARRWPQRWGGR